MWEKVEQMEFIRQVRKGRKMTKKELQEKGKDKSKKERKKEDKKVKV